MNLVMVFVLAVFLDNDPYIIQPLSEPMSLKECQTALVNLKDKDVREAAVCIGLPSL